MERTRRVIAYLDRNYEFDVDAPEQMKLSSPPLEFLSSGSTGTSMDFATATVLLVRAMGIPARLATGYLSGRFDPLSGTYVVLPMDRHAWAEVYFSTSGWVPFDGSPRLAATALGEGATYNSPLLRSLFGTSYAEGAYGSLRSPPQWVSELMDKAFGDSALAIIAPVVGAAGLVLAVILAWKLPRSRRRRSGRPHYARLPGDARAEMLRIYLAAERLLIRAGLSTRSPWQTVAAYTGEAESTLGDAASSLGPLRDAAWTVAYDPQPFDAEKLPEARRHLSRLKSSLKSRRTSAD